MIGTEPEDVIFVSQVRRAMSSPCSISNFAVAAICLSCISPMVVRELLVSITVWSRGAIVNRESEFTDKIRESGDVIAGILPRSTIQHASARAVAGKIKLLEGSSSIDFAIELSLGLAVKNQSKT